MDAQTLLENQWPYLLSLLPAGVDLDASARQCGALMRRRGVDSAEALLRVILAHALCGLPLRHTAAWAELAGVASVSNVALLKRLRKSTEWMGWLLGRKLAERAPPPALAGEEVRARLIDATCISHPGAPGTVWRVHLGYDLKRHRIDHVELTDIRGGETLTRFAFQPGELVVGDRGYANRPGLHAVVKAGALFVVRHHWHALPLAAGFDLFGWLRGLPDAAARDVVVQLAADSKRELPALSVRLAALRKTEAAAESARRDVLRECSRKQKQPDPRSLEAAGYVCVVSNADSFTAAELLGLYRFRWQVELEFKRLKGLLQLGELPTKDPPTARTYLYAKLLGALLLDDLTERFLGFSPWGYPLA